MFWKYNSPSSTQIEELLQQEIVSLHALMEEEELLQECKSQNKKLIEYLTRVEVLEELIALIVNEPPEDVELKVRFKHANLACELLTCEVPAIIDKLVSSTKLLLMLYKFFENEKPLNPLMASFVSRVFCLLIQRRSEQNWYSYQLTCFQLIDFFKSQKSFVHTTSTHIGTSAVMDLLSKLICGINDDDHEIERNIHEWLDDCHLIEQLVDKLSPECDSEEHANVDLIIRDILPKGTENSSAIVPSEPHLGVSLHSKLLCTLESENVINRLLDIMLREERNESSVSHVINILLNLLSYKSAAAILQSSSYPSNFSERLYKPLDSHFTVLQLLINRLPDLQVILSTPPKSGYLLTAYGAEVERLGSTRLKLVSLVVALIETCNLNVHKTMVRLKTLDLLFDLFYKFALNNFLHTQVTQAVRCILSQPVLFSPCNSGILSLSSNVDELLTPAISEVSENSNHTFYQNGVNTLNQIPGEIDVNEFKSKLDFSEGNIPDFNNKHSSSLLSAVISGSTETTLSHPLLTYLFSEAQIIQKVLTYFDCDHNENLEKKNIQSLTGYGGHMGAIANCIVENSNGGSCASMIKQEIEKLPDDIQMQWCKFIEVTLQTVNEINKIVPFQAFDEELDNLGEFRFVEDFKEVSEDGEDFDDEGILSGVGKFESVLMDEELPGIDKMSKFFSHKSFSGIFSGDGFDSSTFTNHSDSELTEDGFNGRIEFSENLFSKNSKEVEAKSTESDGEIIKINHRNSSSDEEEMMDYLEDDEFATLRKEDYCKMDVDFHSDLSDMREKSTSKLSPSDLFNPWLAAPVSDTVGVSNWANFDSQNVTSGQNVFSSQDELFNQPIFEADFSSHFSNKSNHDDVRKSEEIERKSDKNDNEVLTSVTNDHPKPEEELAGSQPLLSEKSGVGGTTAFDIIIESSKPKPIKFDKFMNENKDQVQNLDASPPISLSYSSSSRDSSFETAEEGDDQSTMNSISSDVSSSEGKNPSTTSSPLNDSDSCSLQTFLLETPVLQCEKPSRHLNTSPILGEAISYDSPTKKTGSNQRSDEFCNSSIIMEKEETSLEESAKLPNLTINLPSSEILEVQIEDKVDHKHQPQLSSLVTQD